MKNPATPTSFLATKELIKLLEELRETMRVKSSKAYDEYQKMKNDHSIQLNEILQSYKYHMGMERMEVIVNKFLAEKFG